MTDTRNTADRTYETETGELFDTLWDEFGDAQERRATVAEALHQVEDTYHGGLPMSVWAVQELLTDMGYQVTSCGEYPDGARWVRLSEYNNEVIELDR